MVEKKPASTNSEAPADDLQPIDVDAAEVKPDGAPPEGAKTHPPISPLEKQVRALKVVTTVLFLALLSVIGAFLYIRHMSRPVQIVLDGKPIATVKSYGAAIHLLADAEHAAVGDAYPEDSFVRMQKIQFIRTSSDAPIDSEDSVRHELSTSLKLKVRAYVIKVDDKPTIGLPTSQAAVQTLAEVKQHYVSMPPNAPLVGLPTFRQRVVIDRMPIAAADARRTPDDAAAYFWTPPPARTYTVKQGDRGYTIAVRHHIPFADFLAANAGRNMNKLQPGDVVNLNKVHPFLGVEVKKRLEADEQILPGADPDRAGKRHVVYVVTYTNGEETRRDILSMVTLSRPHPRMSL
jgi:LysM repeat protein